MAIKLPAFGLIVCILLLSMQVCGEIATGSGKSPTRSQLVSYFDEQDQDDAPSKDCAPFCICSCRQVLAPLHEIAPARTDEIAAVTSREQTFVYRPFYSASFDSPIWQPPKA